MQGIDKWRGNWGDLHPDGVLYQTWDTKYGLEFDGCELETHGALRFYFFFQIGCKFELSEFLKKKTWHVCFSLRKWRCDDCPVSQCPLSSPGGSPLPEPLNVAPSLSSHEEDWLVDACKDFGTFHNLSVPPCNPGRRIPTLPLWNMSVEKDRNGKKNWKWTKTSLIYPQKASLEECQRSSVNFLNMPYINDCTYLLQWLVLKWIMTESVNVNASHRLAVYCF